MTAVLYTPHFIQFFDDDGEPLAGGKLYTYSAGTTTPKATFTTAAATVENPNPIILDAYGRAVLFIAGSYRFDLRDANDVPVPNGSADNVTSFTTIGESEDSFFQSFSGNGSTVAFTLSEDLGTDEKTIMVFVDAGGGEGFNIQPISAYTLNGTTLTFNSAPASGTNNIQVWAPSRLAGAAAASAAEASASASSAASDAAAAASDAAAVNAAVGLTVITSTTSNTIGTGSKTFTVASGLGIEAGQWVIIVSDANPTTNYMTGQITSYSTTTLQVNVTQAFGSGTHTDWTLKLSGVQGATGPAGGISGGTLTGNISGDDTYTITNVIDPTNPQDVATKAYVDAAPNAPTFQILTSGTTYTTPAGCTTIVAEYVGAGGGGGGNNTAGSAGGDTTFNSVVAKGGSGGGNNTSGAGGAGGTGGTGTATLRVPGNGGCAGDTPSASVTGHGGAGGGSYFGGGGPGMIVDAGVNGTYGGGGSGSQGGISGVQGAGGGGAGEYVMLVIASPAASYAYAIGAGGAGGALQGGAGGSGLIKVTEYY